MKEFLDRVNSQRQNVYAFLQAQDSWTQTEIDQILAADELYQIATKIVDQPGA